AGDCTRAEREPRHDPQDLAAHRRDRAGAPPSRASRAADAGARRDFARAGRWPLSAPGRAAARSRAVDDQPRSAPPRWTRGLSGGRRGCRRLAAGPTAEALLVSSAAAAAPRGDTPADARLVAGANCGLAPADIP